MKMRTNLLLAIRLIFLWLLCQSCSQQTQEESETRKPNIILIMADDMGAEALSCYGNLHNQTPHLDAMASEGFLFKNCISQPLCTPSRVKIMTGKYNYRNYERFGHLPSSEYTFGNLFEDHGYETCIVGKWQLNGIYNKGEVADWNDVTKPNQFGFQEYSLWQLTKEKIDGERYADPIIEQNGEVLPRDKDLYGPDVFCDYLVDFVKRKKDQPFFVYYPMVLVHDPFVPTPDSELWPDDAMRYKKDTAYFKEMVEYADKLVGKIIKEVEALDMPNETLVLFTGDNGTHPTIHSGTKMGVIQGAKGNTIDAGVHVPLLAKWIGKSSKPMDYAGIIEFSDFFATFEDMLDKSPSQSDGKSFLGVLNGDENTESRNNAFVHYDPRWSEKVNQNRDRFVQTNAYKLYQDGSFYDIINDRLEQNKMLDDSLSALELETKEVLQKELSKHPAWK